MTDPNEWAQSVKNVGTVVRALVSSRKPPCRLRDLLRDYPHVENETLPFRKLGFNTAEELLRACDEFEFMETPDDLFISNKPNKKSDHIVSMVRLQKASTKPPMRARHPKRVDLSWNKTSYNSTIHKPNQRARFPNGLSLSSMPLSAANAMNMKNYAAFEDANNNVPIHSLAQPVRVSEVIPQFTPSKAMPLKDLQIENIPEFVPLSKKKQQQEQSVNNHNPRPILGNNSSQKSYSTSNDYSKFRKSELHDNYSKRVQHELTQRLLYPNGRANNYKPSPIQDRLNKQPKNDEKATADVANSVENSAVGLHHDRISAAVPTSEIISNLKPWKFLPPPPALQQRQERELYVFNSNLNDIENLEKYCKDHKYDAPKYHIFSSARSDLCLCRLHINDCIYSTHPVEFREKESAKAYCAQKAIEKIVVQMKRNLLPKCTDSDEELIDKLYDIVADHEAGIFAHHLPDMFEELYQRVLPEEWWTLLQYSLKFNVEKVDDKGTVIILAKTMKEIEAMAQLLAAEKQLNDNGLQPNDQQASVNSASDCVGAASTAAAKNRAANLYPSVMIGESKFWSIHVTCCVSTVEIYGQLLDLEAKFRMDELELQLAKYMRFNKQPALNVVLKEYYLVCVKELWIRVCVNEIDEANQQVLLFFIDFGGSEWIDKNELYECESQFLCEPAKAICMSLFGLEDFAGHPRAQKLLDEQLKQRTIVAKIITRQEDCDLRRVTTLCAVLYDTSTQTDVSINPELIQLICENDSAPELTQTELNKAKITTICDNGDVYLQVLTPDLLYIQNLLETIIASKFRRSVHQQNSNELSRSKLYLVHDETGQQCKWFRAAPTTRQFSANDKQFEMFYVDFGITRMTAIENIFCLESLSTAGHKFPPQALLVRLHGIPCIKQDVVGSMRALLPINAESLVKMIEFDENAVPLVKIFEMHSNGLRCINQSIIDEFVESDAILQNEQVNNRIDEEKIALVHSKQQCINAVNQLESQTPVKDNELKMYTNIPDIEQMMEIRVMLAFTPNNFAVQPYKECDNFHNLMDNLQDYFIRNKPTVPDKIETGEAYAACNPVDNYIYRVTVLRQIQNDVFHVFFCDFGDTITLTSNDLRYLPEEFRKLPKLAIQTELHGVAPINGEWSFENCKRFRELTIDKKFIAVLKKKSICSDTHVPKLSVELIDVSSAEDVYINQLFAVKQ